MSSEINHLYEFNAFRLDTAERQLLHDGAPVPLTPKAFDTLVALVERRGHLVEKEELMKLVWADAFVEEANLARCVHTLRKALGDGQNGHKYIETVPKRGYRFVAEVRETANGSSRAATTGEVEATQGHADAATENLKSAEVDDIKPNSRHENEAVPNGFSLPLRLRITPTPSLASPHRRLVSPVFIAPLALIVVVAVGAYIYFNRSRQVATDEPPIDSIAVLPFVNVGDDPEVEYLSDGISESLINDLSRLPNLSVKGRSFVLRYKGKEVEPQIIAAELSVQAILSGRVMRHGDDLTLSLSLVDARNGNQIWGEQYNRKMTNLVTLQNEIVRDVSQKLRVRLSGADEQKLSKSYTTNAEAYRLYLQGKYYADRRNTADARNAISYFEKAIELDPHYALAYAGKAYAHQTVFNMDVDQQEEIAQARAAVTKALELDETLAEAHVALAEIKLTYDWDFTGSEKECRRAIELDPNNADAHRQLAFHLNTFGRVDEALAEVEIAIQLDPSSFNKRARGMILYFSRRYDEAIAQLKQVVESDPSFKTTYHLLSFSYEMKQDYRQAFEWYLAEKSRNGASAELLAALKLRYAAAGWRGVLQEQLKVLRQTEREGSTSFYNMATLYAQLGEKERAFESLQKACEKRELNVIFINRDPQLDPLRDDPRFQDLVRRVGLSQ